MHLPFLSIPTFYIICIVLVALCILDILYITIVSPKLNISRVKGKIEKSFKGDKKYMLVKSKVDGADLKLIYDDKDYYIKVVPVKDGCDLQINNIDTFVMYTKYGNNMKNKVMNDMSDFMNSKMENRIIMLSSNAKTIKKVINECEMIMVDNNTNVYNTKVINYNQIENFINNL